jgi:hypothetical protein
MLTFPTHLFNPAAIKMRAAGVSVTGGESLLGESDTIKTDGGGYWIIQMSGIELRTPDLIRAWRAWEDTLDQGTTRVLVPVADLRQAPRPTAGGRPSRPSAMLNSSDDPYFPEAVGFATPWIVAHVTAARPLRATSINIQVDRGARLKGGEVFAIDHATVGRRVYRVARVTARPDAQTATVEIRTPLREAIDADTPVDFDWPSLVATLLPEADISPDIEYGRRATVDIAFREAF